MRDDRYAFFYPNGKQVRKISFTHLRDILAITGGLRIVPRRFGG
jgi:hypothetical protein